jgi:hypothetical protein
MYRSIAIPTIVSLAALVASTYAQKLDLLPVANAGSDQTIYTQAATATVSLDGSASFDPEGAPLVFSWNGPGLAFAPGPTRNVVLAPGTHTYTLSVSDKSAGSDTDTVVITVVSDTTPPRVNPPDDIWVGATEVNGAKGADSNRLSEFLAGGTASDIEDPFRAPLPQFAAPPPVVRLAPHVNGVAVGDSTLIPMGTHVVTFRFRDGAGNIGTGSANLTVFDLRDEDLFVGVPTYVGGFGGSFGTVKQIRSGTVMDWCSATIPDHLPDYFETPGEVIVDSQGRVVVIAGLHRPSGWGLFRCNAPGQPIEKLVFLPATNATAMNHSTYPSLPANLHQLQDDVWGLHLAHEKMVVIDDDVNNGEPRIVTEDSYVFKTRQGGTPCGQGCGPERSLRYRTRSDKWELGPEPINKGGSGDMTNYKGETYSVSQWGIRHEFNPLQISLEANLPNFGVRLDLFAFGGILDLFDDNKGQRLILDDTRKADGVAVNCPPQGGFSTAQPDMQAHPNAYQPFGGALEVVFDRLGFNLTIGRFQGGEDGAYLTNVSPVLLDADPFNDKDGYYIHDFSCALTKKLGFTSITDPQTTSVPRSVRRLAAVKQGLVGTAHFGPSADVIRIHDGFDERLASFSAGPLVGIGGWPPMAGQSNAVIIHIRIDSPVDALLTDSSGRKLGVENGVAVNDFGIEGFDSGPGEPRVFGIKSVSPGDFTLRSIGTGSGPFTVHVYAMKLDEPAGRHILMRGDAVPGSQGTHDFSLQADGSVNFANQAPVADAGPDQTVNATGTAGAQVSLDGSGSSDPDGDALGYVWSGPFGQVNGAVITPTLPAGAHVLTLNVADGKGGFAEDKVTVTVNAIVNVSANAGPDKTVRQGSLVTLNGTGSSDGPGPLGFTWTQAGGPAVAANGTNTATLTFTPQHVGVYTFGLVVSDGPDSAADSAMITVPRLGDIDLDDDVDRDDQRIVVGRNGSLADGPNDLKDVNGDGNINVADARRLSLLCTRPQCAVQ